MFVKKPHCITYITNISPFTPLSVYFTDDVSLTSYKRPTSTKLCLLKHVDAKDHVPLEGVYCVLNTSIGTPN